MATTFKAFDEADYVLKVLIIGDSGVGKSCLLNKYVDDIYIDHHLTTIGVDFKIKTIDVNGKIVKLQIWDTAGQERFRVITTSYYRGASAVLAVFDLTSRESFENLEVWLEQVYKLTETAVIRPTIIIVGTKSDKVDKNKYAVNPEDIHNFCEERGFKYFETSAVTGKNLNELFLTLSQDTIERKPLTGGGKKSDTITLLPDKPTTKKCC